MSCDEEHRNGKSRTSRGRSSLSAFWSRILRSRSRGQTDVSQKGFASKVAKLVGESRHHVAVAGGPNTKDA